MSRTWKGDVLRDEVEFLAHRAESRQHALAVLDTATCRHGWAADQGRCPYCYYATEDSK